MQWEVFLIRIWFLVGALRRVCDFVIQGVDAWLKESFEDELKSLGEEIEVFVDVVEESPREFQSKGVASTVLAIRFLYNIARSTLQE